MRAIEEDAAPPVQDRHAPGRRRRAARAGVRTHPTHRRRQWMVFRRSRCGGCADGSTAAWAVRACRDIAAIPTPVPSATSSTGGASRLTSLTASCGWSAGLKLPGRGWLEFRVDAARRRSAIAASARRRLSTREASRADSTGTGCCRSTRSSSAVCCGGSRGVPDGAPSPRTFDLHSLLDHRRASGRGVPLARAAGSARGADSRGAGANRRARGRHPRRRVRHAIGRHRPRARVRWVVRHSRLHRRPALLRRAGARTVRRLAACASVRADRPLTDALRGSHRVRGLPGACCPTASRLPCSARCSRLPSRTAIAS